MEAVLIRVPYKNLKQEVELAGFDGGEQRRRSQIQASSLSDGGDSPPASDQLHPPQKHCSLLTLILSCTVAARVQFGWALQLSFLTPYIQEQLDPFSLVADVLSILANRLSSMVIAKVAKLASAAEYFFKMGVEGKTFQPTFGGSIKNQY